MKRKKDENLNLKIGKQRDLLFSTRDLFLIFNFYTFLKFFVDFQTKIQIRRLESETKHGQIVVH